MLKMGVIKIEKEKSNKYKIAFITCVNNNEVYNKCRGFVNRINTPKNMEIEFIEIRDTKSMAEGYNKGMNSTNAKYKVYIHQDVFIINTNFIYDLLKVFNSDDNIGLIGVIGSKDIPNTGIWWEGNKVGKVIDSHTGNLKLLDFNKYSSEYESVKAIDGLLMVTSYDIKWREDLFDGWHFYDISQCCEFIKRNKSIIVPKQKSSWCIHDCGEVNMENYENYRKIFVDTYLKHNRIKA